MARYTSRARSEGVGDSGKSTSKSGGGSGAAKQWNPIGEGKTGFRTRPSAETAGDLAGHADKPKRDLNVAKRVDSTGAIKPVTGAAPGHRLGARCKDD